MMAKKKKSKIGFRIITISGMILFCLNLFSGSMQYDPPVYTGDPYFNQGSNKRSYDTAYSGPYSRFVQIDQTEDNGGYIIIQVQALTDTCQHTYGAIQITSGLQPYVPVYYWQEPNGGPTWTINVGTNYTGSNVRTLNYKFIYKNNDTENHMVGGITPAGTFVDSVIVPGETKILQNSEQISEDELKNFYLYVDGVLKSSPVADTSDYPDSPDTISFQYFIGMGFDPDQLEEINPDPPDFDNETVPEPDPQQPDDLDDATDTTETVTEGDSDIDDDPTPLGTQSSDNYKDFKDALNDSGVEVTIDSDFESSGLAELKIQDLIDSFNDVGTEGFALIESVGTWIAMFDNMYIPTATGTKYYFTINMGDYGTHELGFQAFTEQIQKFRQFMEWVVYLLFFVLSFKMIRYMLRA
jgi:hypothetical protein